MHHKQIIAGIVSLTLMLAIGIMNTKPASAITRLGGVSVYNACKYQYTAAFAWEVFILSSSYNVMGWRCYLNNIHSGSVSVNLNRECKRVYGTTAKAGYDDFNNPYSWYCYKD